jgi:hypothetical protein
MFSKRNILGFLAYCSISLLMYSCANRGYPKGGPKDEDPPIIVKEDPVNGSTNFSKKKLNIYFDEFVQLKDVASNFMISPPQKKKPKVKLRGMRVLVEFQDTLRNNTTYSLDFGSSIVDNNEGNSMGHYRYFFSTGKEIDTMRMGGNLFDSYTHKPIENAYVMLYDENSADSIPILEMPRYVARTDTAGYFSITNIKNQKYKVMAIDDADKNFMLTSPTEKVAYSDSIFKTVVFPMTKRDTASQDSTATLSYTAFGPENIELYMFEEKPNQQYLLSSERKERGSIDFTFAIPRTDSLKVDLFGIENEDDVFLKEINSTRDTIKYWIVDTTIFSQDTLEAELRYLKTDTLGMLVEIRDTVNFDFEDEEIFIKTKKNKKKNKKKINFLKMDFNISGTIDIDSKLSFEFEQPVLEDFKDKIILYKFENDTTKLKQEIEIKQDKYKLRKYNIDYKWIPEGKYSIEVDSAAIHSVFGKFNNKIESKLAVKAEDVYGKIFITLENGEYPMILNLIKESGKEYKNVKTIYPDKDGTYTIKYVKPGKYSFRAVADKNGNKIWDTGNYLKHIQPENVVYLKKTIDVRENWDFEETIDFLNLYILK